jgi:hypothetical protein
VGRRLLRDLRIRLFRGAAWLVFRKRRSGDLQQDGGQHVSLQGTALAGPGKLHSQHVHIHPSGQKLYVSAVKNPLPIFPVPPSFFE